VHNALNFVEAGIEYSIAARATQIAHTGGVLHFPRPRAKAKVSGRQCPYRTDVGGVAGVFAIKLGGRVADNFRVAPAIVNCQNRVAGNFIFKADAAGAQNAAFCIKNNQVTQRFFFGSVMFVAQIKTRDAGAVGIR